MSASGWVALIVLGLALSSAPAVAAPATPTLAAGVGMADSTLGASSRPGSDSSAGATPAARAFAPASFLIEPASGAGEARLAPSAEAKRAPASPAPPPQLALSAERARILLRSLTLPGWGQATLGRPRAAAVFGLAEAAIWGAFTAFRIQDAIRQDNYLRLARISAGIDLRGRDEEWRRIVGGFASSDDYNRLVVARDAANLYYNDPAAYRAYIEEHSLRGADVWRWASPEALDRYRSERQYAQRAAQRANTVLAVAVANRIVSALHAARVAGRAKAPAHAWRVEAVPVSGLDPAGFQVRVRAQF